MDTASSFCRSSEDLKHRGTELILIDIASPGGDVNALNQILSVMNGCPDVRFSTYCSAMAYSAAAVILGMGAPDMRFMSPFATAMLHSVLFDSGFQGLEEHKNEFDFIDRQNTRIIDTLAKAMKLRPAKLLKTIRDTGARNLWLFPEEALALGLVDHIGIPEVLVEAQVGLRANLMASKA
ncbi:MAG: ATP-dependent Clp protease proteolytic subunit [Desulfobacterales bacterium]|nr:ATP-dependent Clp protease proteolytic subunit [Desulfobacterales bacterium]